MSDEAVTRPPVTSWRDILGIVVTGILLAAAFPFVSAGFLAGCAWWGARWLAAGVVVGFHAGNRADDL